MSKTGWKIAAAFFCLGLALACAPALAQDSAPGPTGGYNAPTPPSAPSGPGGPGGMGPMGPGMGGRPALGPPHPPLGRYQVVSGSYVSWQGGKPANVPVLVRIDGQTGETWLLQENTRAGQVYREWVRINETR